MHAPIAKLAIDWLSVIPFTIHPVLQTARLQQSCERPLSIACSASYGDIVNYNTIARARRFFGNFFGARLRGLK